MNCWSDLTRSWEHLISLNKDIAHWLWGSLLHSSTSLGCIFDKDNVVGAEVLGVSVDSCELLKRQNFGLPSPLLQEQTLPWGQSPPSPQQLKVGFPRSPARLVSLEFAPSRIWNSAPPNGSTHNSWQPGQWSEELAQLFIFYSGCYFCVL